MKNCIFLVVFLALFINPIFSAEQQNSRPTLVFYVEHEEQLKKDYIELTLSIEAKDTSLTMAIQSAANTVAEIETLAKDYCSENSKKRGDCKDIVETGKFNVDPKYQLIRKEPVFMGFTVTHEMTISIKAVQNIGHLVDKILTKPGIKLQAFDWKALEEPKTHEEAVAEGMEEGEGLCKQLGLKMGRIISVEQITEDEMEEEKEENEEDEEEEEEEDEEEELIAVFRFEVECEEIPSKK